MIEGERFFRIDGERSNLDLAMPSRYDRFRTHTTSRRLYSHDYARGGTFFITICVRDRLPLFGDVCSGVMGLSEAGLIAWSCWRAMPEHVPALRSEAFIVMPNHVHALFHLKKQRAHAQQKGVRAPRSGSLGQVVGQYKAAVTRTLRGRGIAFAWQPRYHDHVVRSADAFEPIRTYILHNPAHWHKDKLNPQPPRRRPPMVAP